MGDSVIWTRTKMKKYYLNSSAFYYAFYLLMEEEKSSGKKRNLLHKKILNKELTYEQFESLFKEFRKNLQTKAIRFYDNYAWFEVDNLVLFAGTPEQEKERAAVGKPIKPSFIVNENGLTAKLGFAQADLCGACGSYFYNSQSCWPIWMWEFPIVKISKSKRYAQRFKNAMIPTLKSFEIPE